MKRRVVITGMGAVTPLGQGVPAFWQGIREGRSGIAAITRFDVSNTKVKLAGEVREFDSDAFIDRKEKKRMDRFSQYAVVAAGEALSDAGLLPENRPMPDERMGVAAGSGIGGIETFEEQHQRLLEKGPDRVSPFFIPMMIGNMAAGNVSIVFRAKGPSTSSVTACSSGTHSIGEAFKIVQDGRADVMIAGGTEAAITPLAVAGFNNMQALSTAQDPEEGSRPFDARRDGFVIAEGAGMLILEELDHALKRGAHIYAEVVGFGASTDAYHITSPAPGGVGGAQAMTEALKDAGIRPQDVDYINAHGTSTAMNDRLETQAIKLAFGEHAYKLAVSSTKSMTGHLLGAAGAVEAIVLAKSLQEGFIPATIHYGEADPECDLDYVPNTGREKVYAFGMSNSLGFGGHNGTILFKRYEERCG